MTRLVRTELLKLRTTRMNYGLLAAAGALTALISVLIASRAGHAVGLGGDIVPSLATQAGLTRVVTATRFGMLFATVFGVIVSSGEFRHGRPSAGRLDRPPDVGGGRAPRRAGGGHRPDRLPDDGAPGHRLTANRDRG